MIHINALLHPSRNSDDLTPPLRLLDRKSFFARPAQQKPPQPRKPKKETAPDEDFVEQLGVTVGAAPVTASAGVAASSGDDDGAGSDWRDQPVYKAAKVGDHIKGIPSHTPNTHVVCCMSALMLCIDT